MTRRDWARSRVVELVDAMRPGDVLPPERELSAELGVARMTLRRAVDDLVRDGRVVRRQGSGTYVAEPKLTGAPTTLSFTQRVRAGGHTPTSRTLDTARVQASAGLARQLHVSPATEVLVVRRLRLVDDEPLAVETLHVPSALVPGLTGQDLEDGSFYELLERRWGMVVTGGTQAIEPTVTDDEESGLLGVPPYSPAFRFEVSTWTDDGVVVEYLSSVHRGDRSRLVVALERPDHERPSPDPLWGDGHGHLVVARAAQR